MADPEPMTATLDTPPPPPSIAASPADLPAPRPDQWRSVNRLQLAQLLGAHPDTVTDYTRQGMPVITRGGRGKESAYDAVECLAWWRSHQGQDKEEQARARQADTRATLNEIQIAKERGALIARDQVLLEGQHYTKAWSAKVRALPRRLVELGLIGRELEPRVAVACREILTEIAAWKTLAHLKRATTAKRKHA